MEDHEGNRADEHHNVTYEYDGGGILSPAADLYPQKRIQQQQASEGAEQGEHDGAKGYMQQPYQQQQPYMQQQQQQHIPQSLQHQQPFYPSQQQARPYMMQSAFRPRYVPFVPAQQLAGMPGQQIFPGEPHQGMPPQHYGPAYMHVPPVQHMANMSLGRPQGVPHHNARPPPQHYGRPAPMYAASHEHGYGSSSPASPASSMRATGIPTGASTLPAKPAFASPSIPQADGRFTPSGIAETGIDNDAIAGTDGDVLSEAMGKRKSTNHGSANAPTAVSLLARLPAMPARPDSSGMTAAEVERAYQAREDALLLRIEAIGFEPEAAWKVAKQVTDGGSAEVVAASKREYPASALGVRLLQRVDTLQRENDELGRLLQDATATRKGDSSKEANELKDAQTLIDGLDAALTACKARAEAAEAKVRAQEQALAVACAQSSTGITPTVATHKASTLSRPAASQQQPQQTLRKGNRGGGKNAWKAASGDEGAGAGK